MELIKEELSAIVNKIIEDGRKYNMIDRFFHYKIERENLYKKINAIKFSEENVKLNKAEFSTLYHEYLEEIDLKIKNLIETIKSSFGIDDFVSYKLEGKSKIIENPNLLGISPFLFDIIDLKKILKHDILNFKFGSCAFDFQHLFIHCLDDTLYRLNSMEFLFYNAESVNEDDEILFYNSDDILDLFRGEIFYVWDNFDTKANKEKVVFLKSEILKNSIKSKVKINLSFALADKVFKKYFEINFTKDRCDKIYPIFRIFLKTLFNKASMEAPIETIYLNQVEVKKMIGFFSFYKSTKPSPNIFTYEVQSLFVLLERISGLESKTSWEKTHSENKYKIDKVLKTEIDSIIPNESALLK